MLVGIYAEIEYVSKTLVSVLLSSMWLEVNMVQMRERTEIKMDTWAQMR